MRSLLSILYTALRLLIDLALLRSRSTAARDLELLALRHEVRVLRRSARPHRWWPGDRLVLAALSQRLARSDWGRLPVRPETLRAGTWRWCGASGPPSGVAGGRAGRRYRPSRRISFVA